MSNYLKTTDFASKDNLPAGDSNRVIRGAEFDVEFNNIQSASASKADKNNPSFSGSVTLENLTITGNLEYGGVIDGGTY